MRTPEQRITGTCPHCGYEIDAHARVNDPESQALPQDGNFTICFHCTRISRWKIGPGTTALMSLSPDEEAIAETQVADYLTRLRTFNALHPSEDR